MFDTDGGRIATGACIRATERTFADGNWWANPAATAGDAPRIAFSRLMPTLRSKDAAALSNLSDPASTANRAEFDRQSNAIFAQLDSAQIESVPLAYDLGGVIAFYARFRLSTKVSYAPLTFSRNAAGAVRFLPVRSNQLALRLLDSWFVSPVGPSSSDQPMFCAEAAVQQATHRVALSSPTAAPGGPPPGVLLLSGANFGDPGRFAELAERVTAVVRSLVDFAGDANAEGIASLMTPAGAASLRQWRASAQQPERDAYFASLATLRPFFLFDAAALIVVYVRTDAGIQVVYFTPGQNGELRWMNSSHQSIGDEIFKKGALASAAAAEPPFQTIAITGR